MAEFQGGEQLPGSTWYATLGLSRHYLASPYGDGERHSMELLMCTHSALAPARLPQSVQFVAQKLLLHHVAILKGEVFTLPGTVADDSEFSSLYMSGLSCFDEEFNHIHLDDRGATIVWMLPISDAEKSFIYSYGWDAFEPELIERDPDLFDYRRPSLFRSRAYFPRYNQAPTTRLMVRMSSYSAHSQAMEFRGADGPFR